MLAVAVLGGMFALVRYVGWYGSAIAVFFLLCVVAHVAGNAIGTSLRDLGGPRRTDSPVEWFAGRAPVRVSPRDFAPRTELSLKRSLGKPIILVTVAGAVLAGVAGGCGFWWLADGRGTALTIGLGAAASAVLGGIWTFAAGSFMQVTFGEWFRAARGARRNG
jgi:hypothetical protein